jgi:hypothetical protein
VKIEAKKLKNLHKPSYHILPKPNLTNFLNEYQRLKHPFAVGNPKYL